MRTSDDTTRLVFKVGVTLPNRFVAECERVGMDGGADFESARGAIIDLVRANAGQWEFASAEAS